MASKTLSTRNTVVLGTGSLVSISIGAAPSSGKVSLHDCASPGQVGAHNEIWPRGAGSTVTFRIGLVVHHATEGATAGTVTVVTA